MNQEEAAVGRMTESQVRALSYAVRTTIEFVMYNASCDRLTALRVVMSALAHTERKWSRGDGLSLEPSDN